RSASKRIKGRVACPIGSNSKDSAEVIRPAMVGNTIQITVTVTGQTRRRAASIGAGSERIEYGLLACRGHLVDGAQIVRATGGSGSVKIAIVQVSQSLRSCTTTIPAEEIQHRFLPIGGDLEERAKPECSPGSSSHVKGAIIPRVQT